MNFGEYIKFHRKKQNLKMHQAAALLGISASYLSSLEGGKRSAPGFETLQKMAELLDLKGEKLYTLYDLAAESKKTSAVADDLSDYINKFPEIRDMLRYSMECGLTAEDWDKIADYIKGNYHF